MAPGASLPDTEALRRAALQASWARDRAVGGRRLRWRWFTWVATRLLLPLLVVAGVLLLGHLLVQHFGLINAPTAPVDAAVRPSTGPAASGAASMAAAEERPAAAPAVPPTPALPTASAAPTPPAMADEPPRAPLLRMDLGSAPVRPSQSASPQKPPGDLRP